MKPTSKPFPKPAAIPRRTILQSTITLRGESVTEPFLQLHELKRLDEKQLGFTLGIGFHSVPVVLNLMKRLRGTLTAATPNVRCTFKISSEKPPDYIAVSLSEPLDDQSDPHAICFLPLRGGPSQLSADDIMNAEARHLPADLTEREFKLRLYKRILRRYHILILNLEPDAPERRDIYKTVEELDADIFAPALLSS